MKRLTGICAAAVTAAFMSTNATAVNIAEDGIGDVAIAPYYTVRDGWQTLINLTNTTDSPLVVKVRFHEATNSRDVLDFLVTLSAFDVFTGVVRENGDGIAEFAATDQANAAGQVSCTVPSVVANTPQRLNPLGFSGGGTGPQSNDDGGLGGDSSFANPNQGAIDRLSEGYVEFIVMGYADESLGDADDPVRFSATNAPDPNLIGAINVARAIEQHDCANLDLAFSNNTNGGTGSGFRYILDTARQMGEPINALKFNFRLLNAGRGTEAGNAATTWANFYNAGPNGTADATIVPNSQVACTITRGDRRDTRASLWAPGGTGGSCDNLVAAQTQFQFLEPSLNDAFPAVGNYWDDTTNRPRSVAADQPTAAGATRFRGIDAVSSTIQRQALINEWSSNADLGVTTDWIVTMPTKAFYVDQGTGQQYAITLDQTSPNPANTGNGRPEACVNIGGTGALAFIGGGVGTDCSAVPYPPFSNRFAQATSGDRSSARSCNEVGFVFYDRAEQTPEEVATGVIVSPAPPPVVDTNFLCKEANVVTFNGGTALNALAPVNVDTSELAANNGWMFMTLNQAGGSNLTPLTDSSLAGLPVIGFNLKLRNFGDVTKNFASSIDHGFLRSGTAPESSFAP